MTGNRHDGTGSDQGFVLIAVLVFILVVTVAGVAYFAMTTGETRNALYRQNSMEAFYLADGGVERVRAKLLQDRTWRDGWQDEPAGRGTYDVVVSDTSWNGDDAVHLVSTGRVGRARRIVDAIVEVPRTSDGLTFLIMGDADVGGNLCLDGSGHINGDADFGQNDSHLQCGGEYTEGWVVTPPYIYTTPDHFDGATYYYVVGHTNPPNQHVAHIYDRNLNQITTALGDSLVGLVQFNNGSHTYTFAFDGTDVDKYFNQETGIFRRASGDSTVVVNFGAAPPYPADFYSTVEFQGTVTIHSTIVNTRFTGVSEEDRVATEFWSGGSVTLKQVTMEPYNGLALLVHDFSKPGGALAEIGTEDWPALLYATGDAVSVNANFSLVGAMICLGSWSSTGGPSLVFDEGFLSRLPGYLQDGWQEGVSGTMKVLRWRELAAGTNP